MIRTETSRLRVVVVDPAEGGGRHTGMIRTLLENGYAVSKVHEAPAESALDNETVVLRLDSDDAATLEHVDRLREERSLPRGGTWKPWFPVIDYQRCTNCMQCLSFCLFDVYGVDKTGNIQVQNQDNCKTDCPACSRVCPDVAILFPKYRHGPINGDVVREDDVRREAMKVDISALLGGDIYAMLRDRSEKARSRFSRERDDERALKERQKCLAKLQQDLDIPPEVLAALPSEEQIRLKAEAARRKVHTLSDDDPDS